MDKETKSISKPEAIEIHEEPTLMQVINANKHLNNEFIKAIDKINEIDQKNEITIEDIEFLKNIDIFYVNLNLSDPIYRKHGPEIKITVLIATFSESYNKSFELLGTLNEDFSSEKIEQYKIKFIQIGTETEFMLEFIANLADSLIRLCMDIHLDVFCDYLIDLKSEYNISRFVDKANDEPNLFKRKKIFVDAMVECEMYFVRCSSLTTEDLEIQKVFVQKCKKAIEAIDFQIKNTTSNLLHTIEVEKITSEFAKFRITKNKKTDFIKILSAMYDNHMFETEDGFHASNKQELMNEFGKIVNEDLSNYSVLLSKSKNPEKDVFLKPFDAIRTKAEEYYNKEMIQ